MPPGPEAGGAAARPAPRGRHLVALACLALLGLAAYSSACRGAFVFDDLRQVRDNPLVRDLGNYLGSWVGWRAMPNRVVGYATFALSYRLGGLSPAGYHAFNVGVHLVNAMLVYALVVLAFRTPRLERSQLAPQARAVAFVAAALFVAHPLQTQAVTYVVQRLTSLATSFYLGALVLYATWRLWRPPRLAQRAIPYTLALVTSLLAMKTKEIAFTLPFAIVLFELAFFEPERRRLVHLLPFVATALVIPLTLLDLGRPMAEVLATADAVTRVQATLGRLEYLTTQVAVMVTYLFLLLVPVGQNLDHDYPVHRSLLEPEVLSGLVVLLSLAALGVFLWRRSARPGTARPLDPAARLGAFCIAWWFLGLAVESSFIPIADVIYEHRVYLPSVGFFVAVALGLAFAARRLLPATAAPRAIVAAGAILAVALAAAARARNEVWADEISIWSDSARKSPGKARPHLNLGTALAQAGRPREALGPLRRAVELEPRSAHAHAQLGAALASLRRPGEAEPELRAAIQLEAKDPEAVFNLAMLLSTTGRQDESRQWFVRFLEIAPASAGYAAARRVAHERAR